ncbi:SHOCT domain-containing protein [Lysinibacillus sp. NPDC048646]|uniref:SHOCT domain-containing protein n=1 Tax=Lysinibacillus sp. NPDC048646 TaxID=3390574 RepID=UPI003CFFB6A0
MYAIEQIKEYLKPEGRILISNFKKEINLIAEQIKDDETVEKAGVASRGLLKEYLAVLTPNRILTTDKKKKFISFDLDNISNVNFTKKFTTTVMSFTYENEEQTLVFDNIELRMNFLSDVKNALEILPEVKEETDQRKVVRVMKAIKMNIEILNGKEQLKEKGFGYKLAQNEPGTVAISVDHHEAETFKLVKWERVENVQKSASSIAGWAVIGSAFGNAGAIAGAMGANIGKDKSVATLFLKRENGDKVPLVIKCDKKDLEKLSLLIVAEEEEIIQATVTPLPTTSIPTEELIKLKELVDAGILTQDEFDTKKKQLLGI